MDDLTRERYPKPPKRSEADARPRPLPGRRGNDLRELVSLLARVVSDAA